MADFTIGFLTADFEPEDPRERTSNSSSPMPGDGPDPYNAASEYWDNVEAFADEGNSDAYSNAETDFLQVNPEYNEADFDLLATVNDIIGNDLGYMTNRAGLAIDSNQEGDVFSPSLAGSLGFTINRQLGYQIESQSSPNGEIIVNGKADYYRGSDADLLYTQIRSLNPDAFAMAQNSNAQLSYDKKMIQDLVNQYGKIDDALHTYLSDHPGAIIQANGPNGPISIDLQDYANKFDTYSMLITSGIDYGAQNGGTGEVSWNGAGYQTNVDIGSIEGYYENGVGGIDQFMLHEVAHVLGYSNQYYADQVNESGGYQNYSAINSGQANNISTEGHTSAYLNVEILQNNIASAIANAVDPSHAIIPVISNPTFGLNYH